jgi:hypothetical protein
MCFYFLCFIFGIHNTLVLICLVWLFVFLVHVDSMYFPFACGNRYIPPLIPHLCTRYMYINFLVSKAAHLMLIYNQSLNVFCYWYIWPMHIYYVQRCLTRTIDSCISYTCVYIIIYKCWMTSIKINTVCQWFATGWCYFPVSVIDKTDRHDIIEIFFKVALKTTT